MNTILLVEDDHTISLGIRSYLEKHYFTVKQVTTLEEAKIILLNDDAIRLILLDLNLPDGEGFELCEFARKKGTWPVIFLTVCDEEEQIVKGLNLGADDYITKPFKLSILLSRIQAVLRRTYPEQLEVAQEKVHTLACGLVQLDEQKKYVYLDGKKIDLSVGEYKLLHILLSHKNQTLTRGLLLEKLWDVEGQFVNDNTLTVTMKRLREKLNYPSFIKTIRGIGYLVEEEN